MLKEKEARKLVIKVCFVSKPGTPMAETPCRVDHGPNAIIEYYNEEGADCDQQQTHRGPL